MSNLINIEIQLIIENYQQVDKEFMWEDPMTNMLISVMHSLKFKKINAKNIRGIRTFINKNSNLLSNIRGINSLLLASSISAEDKGISEAKYILDIYNKLKVFGVKDSIYLPAASYILGIKNSDKSLDYKMDKYKVLYEKIGKLKGVDPAIISQLVLSNKDISEIIKSINNNIKKLKEYFNVDERFYIRLSVILSLYSYSDDEYCEKIIKLYNISRNKINTFVKDEMYLIALYIDMDKEFIKIIKKTNEIVEVLKEYNEFKEWKILKKITSIVALTLVTDYNIRNSNDKEIRELFSNNMNIVKLCLEPSVISSLNLFNV